MSPSEDRRFNSWKEIATFLDRDIRTVWRWEKERGLPIHRVPGDGRRAVFAYQSEVEAWLNRAEHVSVSLDEHLPDTTKSPDESAFELSSKGTRRKTPTQLVVWVLGIAAVLVAAGLIFLFNGAVGSWALGRHVTRIKRVSPISAASTQGIIIDGEGFGPPPKTILIAPESGGVDTFAESHSTSLRIDDLGEGSHHWIAGRAGPLNHCDITVKLASWTDNRIVLAGFAGPLGTSCKDRFQIAAGDRLQIIIWGPQNQCGPGSPSQCPDDVKGGRVATFDVVVVPGQGANARSCP